MRPRGWLLVLCVLLCVWEPLNLALSASAGIGAMTVGAWTRTGFLTFRIVVAGIGMAAGMAIWNARPHGITLAKAALLLSAASAVARYFWFPGNIPPDLRLPTTVLFVVMNTAWLAYLQRLKRRG